MDIKDLAGLSAPLTKLIETIAQGIGAISVPMLVRKNADAKAYEIKVISEAVEESKKQLSSVAYVNGIITIDPNMCAPTESLAERMSNRIEYQNAKRQTNIEFITQEAAEEMGKTSEASKMPVDSDWISRFFNIAQDITGDEMQRLWGKILAGEVKSPGSFSLRTLDTLRNLSSSEAEVFCKAAALCIQVDGKAFIANSVNDGFLESAFGLSFSDILALKDLGLLFQSDLSITYKAQPAGCVSFFTYANHIVQLSCSADTPALTLPAIVFTKVGKELLGLVSPVFEIAYVQKIRELLNNQGLNFSYAKIVKQRGSEIAFETPLKPLP